MPWKECHVVDERLRFIGRLLDGEQMSALCSEFGISRKTGYKIYRRYGTQPGSSDACLIQLATSSSSSSSPSWMST